MSKAPINLDALSIGDLDDLMREIEAKRQTKREEAKAALIAETTEKAEAIGLTIEELFPSSSAARGRRTRSDAGKSMSPKFKGPNGETWSGRGRTPVWLTAAEKAGKTRDEFRI